MRAAVREAANDVGTHYDAFELMGVKREEASTLLEKRVTEILAPKGITVDAADFLEANAGRFAEARDAYLQATAASPDSAFLYRDLAMV